MDLGWCLATALDLRPGQESKNPFWMALINVACTRLNAEACKYCMCSALMVVWYALLHSGIFFLVYVFALVRGNCHKHGRSCQHQRRMFPSFFTCTVLEVNSSVHMASQKFPIEMRECRASPGSMCPARACVGNWYIWSWNYCVARMVDLLDMPTKIRGATIFYGLGGALGRKK